MGTEFRSTTRTEKNKQRKQKPQGGQLEKPYRGIRMRKWGKWVAEVREPNKRSRIWLGSYSSPVAAARAYDTAVFYLRGRTASLNFPEYVAGEAEVRDASAALIRKRATEVGARVDAIETALHRVSTTASSESGSGSSRVLKPSKPDLNEYPEPENVEGDDL